MSDRLLPHAPDAERVVRQENRFLANAWGGRNIFLTGMAGTGKSTLIRAFLNGCENPLLETGQWPDGSWKPSPPNDGRRVDLTAPTGVAALNIGGKTIHRWSGMLLGPQGDQTNEDYFDWLRAQPYPSVWAGHQRVEACECLVIDEISMLSGRQMSFLEYLFRRLRGNDAPWGGCQVIVVGDFLQLAPVRKDQSTPYDWAFAHEVWERSGFLPILLSKIHRQNEPEFIEALNAVRCGKVTGRAAATLHSRVISFPKDELPRLFTHNSQVDKWNGVMLEGIESEERVYHGERAGDDRQAEFLAKNLMCPEELRLKVGARVMFTVNDKDGRYVNGTIGIVARLRGNSIEIDTGGRTVDLERFVWRSGESSSASATYSQFPLRLAYAMTIHKSQGISLDGAYIDVRAAREPGQAYVALSRVRSLAGLHLKDWFNGLVVSPEAINFYSTLLSCNAPDPVPTPEPARPVGPVRPVRTPDKATAPAVEEPAGRCLSLPGLA